MTPQNKQRGGIMAFLVAVLIALGLWAPSPVPPQPEPTPTPTASPTPAPSALPTPELPWLCKLPESTGTCVFPPVIDPVFAHAVEDAQARVPNEFYDVDGKIRNEHAYVLEVIRWLRVAGYCAIQGTTVADEVWIKASNEFSEHWDIVRADNAPITLYAARCAPAAF
jgi:hypothetical protein